MAHHHHQLASSAPVFISLASVLTTSWIVYRQYRVSRDKQRYKLYDRRLQVYLHALSYAAEAFQKADVSEASSMQMLRGTREAVFLFNDDIRDYLKELHDKGRELRSVVAKISECNSKGKDVGNLAEKKDCLSRYFDKQLVEMPVRFKDYLNLGAIV